MGLLDGGQGRRRRHQGARRHQVLEKAGAKRDGGSYDDRMGGVACWNAVMDENATWCASGTSSSPLDAMPGVAGPTRPATRSGLIEIGLQMLQDRKSFVAWLQAAPMMLVFAVFFILPLVFVTIVSAWDYNEYEMLPAFSLRGYTDTFEGCIAELPGLCTILKTYLKTLKLCLLTWALTLLIGFTVAYFLAFHVRSKTWQIVLFLVCTIPFWTSNVIRMISWIPLLGRNGLVNNGRRSAGLIQQPLEWLLFSEFAVVLASCTSTHCSWWCRSSIR
jgi:hypothetical protein